MNTRQKLGIGLLAGGAIASMFIIANTVMWVDAGEIVVIQSFTGDLRVVTEPGPTLLLWGTPTHYPRRQQVTFRDKGMMQPIQVRFNDGGHAQVSGVVSWEMPLAAESVIRLHKEFRSIEAIDLQLDSLLSARRSIKPAP